MAWLFDEMIKKPLVQGCTDAMVDLFSDFNRNVWDARNNIVVSPASFNGGTVYSTINTIHQNAILPLGAVLLTIFIYWDMYNRVIENNNGGEFTTFDFFKFMITAYLGVTLLRNSMDITMSFFDVGKKLVDLTTDSSVTSNIVVDFTPIKDKLLTKSIVDLILILIGFKLTKLCFAIIGIMVWIIIQVRMFQIFFYITLSAVPLSTFVSKDFRSIGFNYMKNLLAYAFQGVLIILSFSIYRIMIENHIKNITVTDSLGFIFKILGVGVILLALVRQSNLIAKSIVEAH